MYTNNHLKGFVWRWAVLPTFDAIEALHNFLQFRICLGEVDEVYDSQYGVDEKMFLRQFSQVAVPSVPIQAILRCKTL